MLNINLAIKESSTVWNVTWSSVAIFLLICFSVFTYYFMQWNKTKLTEPGFMARYGSLYASVEYDSHKEALKYTWYFCIRRLAFAALIAFFSDWLVIQVLLLTKLGLVMASWGIATTPMINFLNDLAFIANELILLFSSYFILVFSFYVPGVGDRYGFGYVYLTFFGITSVFNLIMLIMILTLDFMDLYRLKKLKKKAKE